MATVIPLDPYRGAKEVVAANVDNMTALDRLRNSPILDGVKKLMTSNINALIKNGDTLIENEDIGRHYAMQEICQMAMENHGLNEVDFEGFSVRRIPGGLGIRFVPRKYSASGNCPTCGNSQGRWLGIKGQGKDSDKVVWGCKNCLEIFWCWEDN